MKSPKDRLADALTDAIRVYREDQASGACQESLDFDAGRIDGIKMVIELLEQANYRP